MIEGYYPSQPSDYLRIELELRKRRNPHYSIRAFARDLELSPSHLSEFLSGKAALSLKKVGDLSQRLKLGQDQKEHWTDLVELAAKGSDRRQKAKLRVIKRLKDNRSQVSLDVYKTIADWYHFAILTFFGVSPRFTTQDLANQLQITELQVKNAIRRLKNLGLLEKTSEGFKPISNSTFAGDADPSDAIRESHRQVLGKAVEALDAFPMGERVNQSLFFSVPKKNLKELKQKLKERVLETISEFSDDGEPQMGDSIQALTWHLFPLENVPGNDTQIIQTDHASRSKG